MTERNWNVALVLAVAVCASAWTWRAMHVPTPPDLGSEVYLAGETMPEVPGLAFGDSDHTLILFASSTCPACTDSMAFYREVLERIRQLPSPPRFAVIGFEEREKLGAYLSAHDLRPDAWASVSHQVFKLRRTPTVLLVGRNGIVKNYWIGRVSEPRRLEILSAIGLLPG